MNDSLAKNRLTMPLVIAALALLALFLLSSFTDTEQLPKDFEQLMAASAVGITLSLVRLALWLALAFALVRVASFLLFDYLYPKRRGVDAPDLARNILTLVAYIAFFTLVFKRLFPDIPLGAVFTTSAVFGVIIGLALQDTLGNLFAGVSLQADKPFLVGDVITVGQWTGVVESITWRGIKIRTFQNHVVIISNSSVAKESIEVCPRDNLNARLIFFNALYSDSPARVIQTIREAVREAENVSPKITPVVRIRGLGDNGVDYEVKYWLENYALHNDTDALVRQRIWYAFRRAGLNFAYPTRTLYVERPKTAGAERNGDSPEYRARVERLAAVDIFAPLSTDELGQLAAAAAIHTFAPNEPIIHAGDEGSSMFVVHRGTVEVKVSDGSDDRATRTVATLSEGDFFGEMALLTGEPRTAGVVAAGETEVIEIGHDAMKLLFETNPDLVESISQTIAERRTALADGQDAEKVRKAASAGILSSIKRFFRLR
jgi:small-conductance mechanosensitive channel